MVMVQGFFLTVSVDTILAAAELAVKHNKVWLSSPPSGTSAP